MKIVLITLIVLVVVFFILAFTVRFKREEDGYYILGLGTGILFSVSIMAPICSLSIPAIDVYRGKTTLEITYKDNIPIDSVVVYKNK